ncbi:ScyD/ScyE family protein [Modestobacter italicus]|uniref:ScyD/ScyE family protein n=1 Tax=Modestobacter italicus (strain DSM 44449 / CECT 9708 / BC 501) TaxID=2732864 RepID=UPI001C9889ED|nr:ScyD/ScyE family protein [Modestobacter italicus]
MKRFRRTAVAIAGAALVVAPATAAQAGDRGHGSSGDDTVTTVATGLDGPRQLNGYRGHRVVVAESDSGEVSAVSRRTGEVQTLLTGLVSPQGVDFDRNRLFVATGEPAPPPEDAGPGAEAPPAPEGATSLVVADPGGEVLEVIDLLAHELAENPDGQVQFDDTGAPVETLSNPYAVLAQPRRVLVADAGANAVLSVDRRTGDVSTFFVPPVVTDVPGCAEAPNNPGTVGCDPVPTGITEGPWGLVYVSTLGAEVPGAGRVYVLSPHGHVVHVIDDLTAPTGLAVDRRGTVYVSNVAEGFPEGEPGPDLDPSTVGEVTRIAWHGERSTAQVTMPTGLLVDGGELYASAWSVAAFLGMPAGSGELVRVGEGAFTPSGG